MNFQLTIKKTVFFLGSYIVLGLGMFFGSLLSDTMFDLIVPRILPKTPSLLLYGLSLIPIAVVVSCGFYMYYTYRIGIQDFRTAKRFDVTRFILVFVLGFTIVLGIRCLVLALSWIRLALIYSN